MVIHIWDFSMGLEHLKLDSGDFGRELFVSFLEWVSDVLFSVIPTCQVAT